MLMVVSLQVDYVMIACILTGIIVCTFIDMQDVPQMSPANESETADRALDLILAVYILSGVFFAPSFFMLPYAAMVFRKRKYTVSRMAAALVGIAVSVDCILKIKHIAPGIFYILEVVLLMAFAVMLSYFTELLLGYQMKQQALAVPLKILVWVVEAVQERCSSMQVVSRQSMQKSVVDVIAVPKNVEVTQLHM